MLVGELARALAGAGAGLFGAVLTAGACTYDYEGALADAASPDGGAGGDASSGGAASTGTLPDASDAGGADSADAGPPDASAPCLAGEVPDPEASRCYRLFTGQARASWTDSKGFCAGLGSHLSVLASEAERDFVKSVTSSLGEPAWIGASDIEVEGEFKWVNGEPWDAYPWAWGDGEPNNKGSLNDGGADCAVMRPTGKWADDDCPVKRPFVCERAL